MFRAIKVERVCHLIVVSLYPASCMAIGSSIGQLQYKCATQLIATIITGYSSGDTNGKKLVPAPRTCTLYQIAQLRGMDSAI